jgi:hypothetical protein
MGKQIGFYMTHEDEKNFLGAISKLAPVKLLSSRFSDKSNMEILCLQPVSAVFEKVYLVNSNLPPRITTRFYSENGIHVIDHRESEVVELVRAGSVTGNTWMNNGRLWFEENSSHEKKSEAFIKWANSLLRWIRSHYVKHGDYWAAPEAVALSERGKLQLGPGSEPTIPLAERRRILGLPPE